MRITSPNPIELYPGFTAESVNYTGCIVRLLTATERDIAAVAIRQKANKEIKEAQANQPGELDSLLKAFIAQKVERQHLFGLGIEAFVSDLGQQVTDRAKIDSFCGLLVEPDEERISEAQEELVNTYRRKRRTHSCPNCNADVECTGAAG